MYDNETMDPRERWNQENIREIENYPDLQVAELERDAIEDLRRLSDAETIHGREMTDYEHLEHEWNQQAENLASHVPMSTTETSTLHPLAEMPETSENTAQPDEYTFDR